ncbi:MAG: hypothetical protein WAW75_06760 [Gallionella sp.]
MKYLIAVFALAFTFNAKAEITGFVPSGHMPNQQEFSTADYGAFPSDYKTLIKDYMQIILKDPESARYTFSSPPKKGWNGSEGFGYIVCPLINAKNSFGGYGGNQLNYFMIQNGKITNAKYLHDRSIDDVIASAINSLCTDKKYIAPDSTQEQPK